ncbi:hypothetical protein CH379_010275 [Leptospira ellisii]|uniref:Uncharacterized protein n=2 Tax=Leptospira ellisii TaxID=2023197 RepID=A0AAE4QN31_9LEPT|nr:hypothetical protein [Leptospira ellisii]MDV6236008.1 hypothetical protein [Leptospira ellisii]
MRFDLRLTRPFLIVISLLAGVAASGGCKIEAPADPSRDAIFDFLIYNCRSNALGFGGDCVSHSSLFSPPEEERSICSETMDVVIQPSSWNRLQKELKKQAALGSSAPPSVSTFGISPGFFAFNGGVLAENGKIYPIPSGSNRFVEMDPEARTATPFATPPTIAAPGWFGGVLAFDGKIHGIPLNGTSFFELDPNTQTVGTYDITTFIPYAGGSLAPNGKIYPLPNLKTSFASVDPIAQTKLEFGGSPGNADYAGGVLGPNGKIYGIPNRGNIFAEIDPKTNSVTTMGAAPGITFKWAGGAIAPNGKIYGMSQTAFAFVEIDPIARTTTVFELVFEANAYSGGVLAPNGKIYGIPFDATMFVEVDPETKTATYFGAAPGGGAWSGGILAPNGKIYGFPYNSAEYLEIDPKANGKFCRSILLSAYLNKF